MADTPPKLAVVATRDPLVLDASAPLSSAEVFVGLNHTLESFRLLHHQQQVFHRWTGTHYQELPTEEIRAALYAFLKTACIPGKGRGASLAPFKPSARKVADVIDALRATCQLPATARAPAWLEDEEGVLPPSREMMACQNGILHLPSRRLYQHTPNFYTATALAYDYDFRAPIPTQWLQFLNSIWPDDPESITALQDIFGYLIGSDTDQQKIPLVVGPKRSGKGTIARVLGAVLGQSAVVSPTLGSLAMQFGLAPLIGKSVGIISDARLSGKADQHAIAERLLSISGEDMQTVDRKFLGAWSGQLGIRFLILTNELPRIADASGALASRFLTLTMTRSFFGIEDHGLTSRLLGELPSILNWAIEGWCRLRQRGYFLQPASSQQAQQELEDLGSPVGAFIRERCTIGQGRQCSINGIYASWEDWCKQQGRDHTGTKQTFGRDLRACVPGLKTTQPRDGGERDRNYEGISLQEKVLYTSADAKNEGFDL